MRAKEFLTERKKSKRRNKSFSGYWYPGYGYYGSGAYDSESGDGGGGESITETKNSNVIYIGDNVAIVGQEHGKRLQLSDQDAERVRAIAQRYGAWYEGNGMDRKLTKGIIDDYQGSWDDDLLSSSIKGYPAPFLYVLFSNIKENDTVEGKIGFDPNSTIFDRILNTQPSTNYFPNRKFNSKTLQQFLQSVSEEPYNFVQMSQKPATESNVRQFFKLGEQLMWPDNWEQYPNRAGRVAKSVNDLRDKFLATRKQGVYVAGSDHLKAVQQFLKTFENLNEEFRVDVPNEEWLQDKIDYAIKRGRNRNGVPYMGTATAYSRRVEVPISVLSKLPGMNQEQQNVRPDDLRKIIKIMRDTGKLPLTNSGKEYEPFINVAYNGEAWVNEGNHRIMAAAKLGWESLPIEIRYFDGGERIEHGEMYPPKIGLA